MAEPSTVGEFRDFRNLSGTNIARVAAIRLQGKTVGLQDKDQEELKTLLEEERSIK